MNSFEAFVSLFQRLRKGREEPVVVEARRRIRRSLQPFPGEAARRIVDVIRNEFQEI